MQAPFSWACDWLYTANNWYYSHILRKPWLFILILIYSLYTHFDLAMVATRKNIIRSLRKQMFMISGYSYLVS